jgi:hypothetical protein
MLGDENLNRPNSIGILFGAFGMVLPGPTIKQDFYSMV